MSHAIEIDSLRVRFGDLDAVASLSLTVEFASVAAILGPNGAGKTTAVETVLGYRRPSEGTIRVMGLEPVRDHANVVQRTGALLQRGGVWFPMSPREAIALTAAYYAAPRNTDELLELCGLIHCATTPWRRLSGGEQQRTLLALSLVGRPRVLVLDEPTSAVDPEGHLAIRELVASERSRGCAIVLTTHQLADAESLADHVTILNEGRAIAQGSLAELAGEPVVILETSAPIDAAALAAWLSCAVTKDSDRQYRCSIANSPELTSRIAAFLAEKNVQLDSLRSRASLEESYLALLSRDREGESA